MPNETTKEISPEQEAKKQLQMLLDLDPFLKGAWGKAKKMGEANYEESTSQIGVENTNKMLTQMVSGKLNSDPSFKSSVGIMSPAQITPEGDIQEGGALSWIGRNSTSDLLKKLLVVSKIQEQNKNTLSPQDQINTLTQTQEMLKKLGIKAKVDVTATGVPTLSTQPELGLADLSPEQQVQAVALARKVAGVRGADRLIPSITENLKAGKTIDQIEDELRMSGQSSEFTGPLRSAAQQIMVGKSSNEQQTAFDTLDDLQGDPGQQKDYLKRMAVVNAPVDQRQQTMGKERTLGLLDEIESDLSTLEKNGISTGFFSGNYENLIARVGQVKNPEMRKIATKIAVAVINYRRAMTGVQFGQIENKEYKTLFPNINKVGNFNTSAIRGLREVFRGDVDTFYKQSMGKKNYDKIFGSNETTQEVPQVGGMFQGEKVINVRRIK